MGCNSHEIKDADGRVVGGVIVCDRRATKRCPCGSAARYLCDEPLRGAKAGKTCDAPMCEVHAFQLGPNEHRCRPHYEAAEKAKREADAWLQETMASDDPDAVDRAVLTHMFPQWPDVAVTYDNRRESERAGERVLHGTLPRAPFAPYGDGPSAGTMLGGVSEFARVSESGGVRISGGLGEAAVDAVLDAFPGARVVDALPETSDERRRREAQDRPARRRDGGDDFADAFAAAAAVDCELAAHAQSIAERVNGRIRRRT